MGGLLRLLGLDRRLHGGVISASEVILAAALTALGLMMMIAMGRFLFANKKAVRRYASQSQD